MIESIRSHLDGMGIDVVSCDNNSITTRHSVGGDSYNIRGFIDKGFPYKAPSYYLMDRLSYGLLAHVGWPCDHDMGLICSGASDVLSLNYHVPEKVFEETLSKTRETIELVLTNFAANENQCLEEFYGHWKWATGSKPNHLFVIAPTQIDITGLKIRHCEQIASQNTLIATSLNTSGVSKEYCLVSKATEKPVRAHVNGVLVPLTKLCVPPFPGEDIREWWKKLLSNQAEELLSALQLRARSIKKNKSFWVICQCLYEGHDVWFGIKAESDKKKAIPIHEELVSDWKLTPIEVDVHSRSRLLPRAGASTDLQDKKVILVGCGAVGSQIAEQLVCAGVGKIHLIDSDSFQSENLYRHTLNMSFAGVNKAAGIAAKLMHEYPYTRMSHSNKQLFQLSEDGLSSADLLVIAIGSPTDERAFNEMLIEKHINVPVIYCWLEGLGVGGHVVFVSEDHRSGCLECSYIDPKTGEIQMHSNMNFLKANEPITKDIGGCGTLFLPYSHLDAIQTATMASRIALQSLFGKQPESIKVSWVGSDNDARNARIAFVQEHNEAIEGSVIESRLKQMGCPCCCKPEIGASYSGLGKVIHIFKSVIETWDKYRQCNANDTEACGILIGSIDNDGSRIWIEVATEPMPNDVRKRFRFHMKDKGHQDILNRLHATSGGRLVFLGTWHSHPEKNPSFSDPDRTGWKECMYANPPLNYFCFSIIGTEMDHIFVPKKSGFENMKKMRDL